MSGVEVAGLALAILPVLMSGAQQYKKCLSPLRRFRRFANEADEYHQMLKIQRSIFQDRCLHLLEGIIDHERASQMISSLGDESWTSKILDEQLTQQLGDSRDACAAIIGLISQKLQDVVEESEQLKSIVEQEKKIVPKGVRDKLWKKHVGEKLRFGFSRSRLEDNIARLRSYNNDFLNLTIRACQTTPTKARLESKRIPSSRKELWKYQTIGRASCQVYEALRRACTKHSDHVAHFQMHVESTALDQEPSRVEFNMAFTHKVSGNDTGSEDRVWFLVDSIINEHNRICSNDQTECFNQLEQSLKRRLEPVPPPAAKKVKKSVRFASSACGPPTPPWSPFLASSLSIESCVGKDFCDIIRRRFCHGQTAAKTCVMLEETAEHKHLVYPSPLVAASKLQTTTSLKQLITLKRSPGMASRIRVHERIGLAKLLAVAVLQYHATPWLQVTWHSKDIIFIGNEGESRHQEIGPDLSAPYITARVQGQSSQVAGQPRSAMARNPLLFGLGVVLLELAKDDSLENLKLDSDAENGQLHSDFFAARRLAKLKGSDMGPRYDRIVEQLVESAFPCEDLNQSVMQNQFYQDVICPLDDLEQGFRKLCLGEG